MYIYTTEYFKKIMFIVSIIFSVIGMIVYCLTSKFNLAHFLYTGIGVFIAYYVVHMIPVVICVLYDSRSMKDEIKELLIIRDEINEDLKELHFDGDREKYI